MWDGVLSALGAAVGVEDIRKINDGYAIFLAAIVTFLGFHLSRRNQILSDRSKNTYALVTVFEDPAYKENLGHLVPYLKDGISLPNVDQIDFELRTHLAPILAKMEYLCVAVREGYVSEKYLDATLRSAIHSVFRSSSKFMHSKRAQNKNKTNFLNFEIFFVRSFLKNRGIVLGFLEWAACRPMYTLSYRKFRLEYWFLRRFMSLASDPLLEDWWRIKDAYQQLRFWRRFVGLPLLFLVLGYFHFSGVGP